MSFPRAGAELVVQGANQFFSTMSRANRSTTSFGQAAGTITGNLNNVTTSTIAWGNALGDLASGGVAAVISSVVDASSAVTDFVGSSIVKSRDLQEQFSAIGSVTKASADEIAQLKTLTSDLALDKNLKVSASEAADAVEALGLNGLKTDQILAGAARSSVLLANATGGSLFDSANLATDAMSLFKIEAENLDVVADGITSVTQNSKFLFNDVAKAYANAGSTFSSFATDADDAQRLYGELNVGIAAVASSFDSGATAGTGLMNVFSRMVPTTEVAKAKMKELGLITADGNNVFFDAQGRIKDVAEVAGVLNTALGDLSVEARQEALAIIFGNDAKTAAIALSQKTEQEIRALQATMANTSAADAAAARVDNLAGDMEILAGVVENAQIQIGDALNPALRALAQAAVGFVNRATPHLVGFFQDFGKMASAVLPSVLNLFDNTFTTLAKNVFVWGKNISVQFAKGIISAVSGIVQALSKIGSVIRRLLKPRSPPLIVPDLDKWGRESAELYFESWSDGDFDILNSFGSSVEAVLKNSLEGVDLSTAVMGAKLNFTEAINEVEEFGKVSDATFKKIVDSIGETDGPLVSLTRSYLELAEANQGVEAVTLEVEAANRKVEDAMRGVEAASKGVETAQEGVEAANRKVAEATREVAEANREVEEVQDNLNAVVERYRELIDPIDQELSEIHYQKEMLNLQKEAQRLEEDLADSKMEGIDNQLKELELGRQKLRLEQELANPELQGLDRHIKELKLQKKTIQLEEFRQKLAEAENETLDDKINKLSLAENERKQELVALQREQELEERTFDDRMEAAQANVAMKEAGVELAQKGVEAAEANVVAAQALVDLAQKGVDAAQVQADAAEARLEIAQALVSERQEEISHLESILDFDNSIAGVLKEQEEFAKAQADALVNAGKEAGGLVSELDSAVGGLADANVGAMDLGSELDSAVGGLADANVEAEALSDGIADATTEVERFTEQVNDVYIAMPQASDPFAGIVESIESLNFQITKTFDEIKETIAAAQTFIDEHSGLMQGALTGVAIVFGSPLVSGAITSVGSLLAGLVGPVGLIVAGSALLGEAWEKDWGGIREATTGAWDALKPALTTIKDWLAIEIPRAISSTSTFLEDTLTPAFESVANFISQNVTPVISEFAAWLSDDLEIEAIVHPDFTQGLVSGIEVASTAATDFIDVLGGLSGLEISPIHPDFAQGLVSGVEDASSAVTNTFENINRVVGRAKDFIKGAFESINEVLGQAKGFIVEHSGLIKGALVGIGIVLAGPVIAAGIAAVGSLVGGITAMGSIAVGGVTSLTGAIAAMGGVTGIITTVGGLLSGLLGAITSIGTYTGLITGFAGAIAGMGGLTGIITTVTSLLAGLVGPINLIAVATGGLTVAWSNDWGIVRDVISGALGVIKPAISTFFSSVVEGFTGFGNYMRVFTGLWESLKPVVSVTLTAIGGAFTLFLGGVVGVFNGIAEAVAPFMTMIQRVVASAGIVFGGLADVLTGIMELITGMFYGNTDAIFASFSKMKTGIIKVVGGMALGVGSVLTGLVDTAIAFASGFYEGVRDFFAMLYTELVGASIVPDMVNDILGWFVMLKDDALTTISGFIDGALATFQSFVDFLWDTVNPAIDFLSTSVIAPLTESFNSLSNPVGKVIGWLGNLADYTSGIDLGVLMPGSPTPFEWGLRGAAEAMGLLAGEAGPSLGRLAGDINGVMPALTGFTNSWGTLSTTVAAANQSMALSWSHFATTITTETTSLASSNLKLFDDHFTELDSLYGDSTATYRDAWLDMSTSLQDETTTLNSAIYTSFETMTSEVATLLTSFWTDTVKLFKESTKTLVDSLKELIRKGLDKLQDEFEESASESDDLASALGDLEDQIGDVVDEAGDFINELNVLQDEESEMRSGLNKLIDVFAKLEDQLDDVRKAAKAAREEIAKVGSAPAASGSSAGSQPASAGAGGATANQSATRASVNFTQDVDFSAFLANEFSTMLPEKLAALVSSDAAVKRVKSTLDDIDKEIASKEKDIEKILKEQKPDWAKIESRKRDIEALKAQRAEFESELLQVEQLAQMVGTPRLKLDLAGAFGGLASTFASFVSTDGIDRQVSAIDSRMESIREELNSYNYSNYDEYVELEKERNDLVSQRGDMEKEIFQLQQQQQDLKLLESQMDLIDLVRDYGLNPADILGDIQLGLDADMGSLLAGLTNAMGAIIEQANQDLQGFGSTGTMSSRNMSYSVPMSSVQMMMMPASSNSTTYNNEYNLVQHTNTDVAGRAAQSFEMMRLLVS